MRVWAVRFQVVCILVASAATTGVPAICCPSPAKWLSLQAEPRSLDGKIKSVGDAEFTVQVENSKKAEMVRFLIDENTRVQGKLTVGAQASVEYHTDGTLNIAERVVVTAPTRKATN